MIIPSLEWPNLKFLGEPRSAYSAASYTVTTHVCPVNRGMKSHIREREDRGGGEVDQGGRFHPL